MQLGRTYPCLCGYERASPHKNADGTCTPPAQHISHRVIYAELLPTRCELNPGKDLAFGNVVVRSYIELLVYEPALHLNTCSRARTCEASPRPAMMLATGRQTRRSPKNALAPPLWLTRSARLRRDHKIAASHVHQHLSFPMGPKRSARIRCDHK